MNKTWPQLSGHTWPRREVRWASRCHPACRCYRRGRVQGRSTRGWGEMIQEDVEEEVNLRYDLKMWSWKDMRWALVSRRNCIWITSGTLYPDLAQGTSLNFSFLIHKMGMMSFLIELNDAKTRSSVPCWLSDGYPHPWLLCPLNSSLIHTYLTSSLNSGISNLTCPIPNSESFPLHSPPPMVFPQPISGNSTCVR